MALGRENHDSGTRIRFLAHAFVFLSHVFCNSVKEMPILFYVLSAVNSAIVNIDMFQKWLQLPTGGKVAELQGL